MLKNYTEEFSDEFTKQMEEFSRFMKEEQLGYLDDVYKGKVRRLKEGDFGLVLDS